MILILLVIKIEFFSDYNKVLVNNFVCLQHLIKMLPTVITVGNYLFFKQSFFS